MSYLARSASNGYPSQPYWEHVRNVLVNGRQYLTDALFYARGLDNPLLIQILELAAEFHDLGKLDQANQEVLSGKVKAPHLPVNHVDAGAAHLMSLGDEEFLSALLVYAHHHGLPDWSDVDTQDEPLRDLKAYERKNCTTKEWVDQTLPQLLLRHKEAKEDTNGNSNAGLSTPSNLKAMDLRILFSCLTHADHGDAACASGQEMLKEAPELLAKERLEALKRYIAALPKNESERSDLRGRFFDICAETESSESIVYCDAPVGTGKTTAVMAHLLRVAEERGLRRIFVILPTTNIITQSVRVYRKALVLDGENAKDVVAEIHHRADFEDLLSRRLTALWDAPIVLTTAVAFWETMASARPSTLRRLQNLPGSAIFLDEAHAMLPVKLLPVAWQWICHMAETWSCHWVLASGSLCRFWELEEFQTVENRLLMNLLPQDEQQIQLGFEKQRVTHVWQKDPMHIDAFVKWLATLEGPVIAVLNTVHTAAAVAQKAVPVFGEGNVLHLSTSLAPMDREITLDLVRARLKYQGHTKWCLVATSCVEAGVDFSFRTGVRENASLLSLLQLAGRVNRNSEYGNADIWTISLEEDGQFVKRHPAFEHSSKILRDFFQDGMPISPEFCTAAMEKELRETDVELKQLIEKEGVCSFKAVQEKFRVIPDDTWLALVDKKLIRKIQDFKDVSWADIQNGSVRVRKNILATMGVQEFRRFPGVYHWDVSYTPFLGYMDAVLQIPNLKSAGGAII